MMSNTYNFVSQPQQIVITYDAVLSQVSQQITSQLLWIGVVVTICALWHMFVLPKAKNWYIASTNTIDMAMFCAGTYLIALYAVTYWGFKPW